MSLCFSRFHLDVLQPTTFAGVGECTVKGFYVSPEAATLRVVVPGGGSGGKWGVGRVDVTNVTNGCDKVW